MSNPTNFYSPETNCTGHQWRKKDEDDDFEYYECIKCGATDSRLNIKIM